MGSHGFLGSIKEAIGSAWRPISLILVLVVIRTFASQSFLTFLPLFYSSQGRGLVSIGAIIAAYTVAGALSGIAAGHAADKLGYKPVFLVGYIAATPALLLLLYLPGEWVYLSSFLAGFFTLATMFPAIALAQALAPKGKSIVSSIMMGFAHGIGGIMTPITGSLAEAFSIQTVLTVVAFVPLLASVMILRLPDVGGKVSAETTGT
jgi:FSR family fosmidomycin resistance protein-like MFS transporter